MTPITPQLLPEIFDVLRQKINQHAEEATALDQAIGDGDHVINLQRGLDALCAQASEYPNLSWPEALQKIGMTVLSTLGGASGSLYGTMFLTLAKQLPSHPTVSDFATAFTAAVAAMKKRGKAEAGEKTLLDVYIPVAQTLQQVADSALPLSEILQRIVAAAQQGAAATRDMIATKGRASFLGERSKGYFDPGARTAEWLIEALVAQLNPDTHNIT